MKPGARFPIRPTIDWPRITLLAGLGAVMLMVLYLTLYWDSNPPMSLLTKTDNDRIDLYAQQVHGVKYDNTGKLVQTLWAQKLDHYPERGQSVLAMPVLESSGKDGTLWNTTAVSGILIGNDEIQLHDNVVIVDREKTMRFESEQLNYFSDKQEAITDVAVKLRRFADVTTAIGMRANLNTNRIELLNRVDSHYAQP
ncbi:MAG TPA: LPS export ABC transporter periplasmic protein LptC [Spongiibacteraceae bacterium]|jgi:LPS export ABC transporter protein LptC